MVRRSNSSSHSKKVVSAVIVGMMAFGPGAAVFADTAVNTTSQSVVANGLFSDVKSGYWAEKHIYKLASQGILLGNNGLFRPNDSVTQQEAVTMAIRFAGLEDRINKDVAVALPPNMQVNNYYKPYAALAIQENLLDKTSENVAVKAKENWGERKASREWITEVLVRALGKESDAAALASKATTFADNSKISAGKRGFVNEALELGLTNGLEGNRFDPQGTVTRAQLATFFSRAESFTNVSYNNTVVGIVTGLSSNKLDLYVDGSIRPYTLDNSTMYFTSDSENKINFADLKPYTKVMIIGNPTKAAYVEVTDSKVQLESEDGTFQKLSPGNILWLETNNTFKQISYDAGTAFLDQNGSKIEPSTLVVGSKIQIQQETFTSDKKPVIIQVKSGVINKNGTGTLQNLDVTAKALVIKTSSGDVESYTWNDSLIVKYQNQLLSPSELKNGVVINYTVKNNQIETIEVTQGVERTIRGSLYEVGLNNTTITYKRDSGQLEVKLLADKPELVISGIATPVLSDLNADTANGDQVEITLNPQDVVTKIQVLNRQMEQKKGATVVQYEPKAKVLTLLDANKKLYVVSLDEKTKLMYDVPNPTLGGIEGFLTNGRKVNITYLSNRALSLEVIFRYEGKVTALDMAYKKLTFIGSDGKSMTLPFTNPIVQVYGKNNASISDVKVGSDIASVLNANQDAILSIQLKTNVQFELADVNYSNFRLTLKKDGLTSQIYVDNSVLTDDNGKAITVQDLRPGQPLNVSFYGINPASVQLVKLTTGEVTAVNTSSAQPSITVKNYGGTTETFGLNASSKIVNDVGSALNISNVAAGNRVEVRKDFEGNSVVKLLNISTAAFWKYDSYSKEIYVKRQNVNDAGHYVLSPAAYIHQGDTTLTVQSLKENDNIVMYLNNGMIVEIQKQ
ncbi:S-layer homology domain-containing protein [Paenibacillus sp.]|jgi:translation elongation factor P/translation initiation factor 5A|uniref:S-layer homology domain-containing protein n=1 Tax=Paenibacillus sp. TaxID=58172 RepID=UPI002822986B|nr:S-layer homology domain-containing protein [Paenibacillus sp.]MDR0270682.1 S-layer homology domain-containing protein [Paenibacillus sp.]